MCKTTTTNHRKTCRYREESTGYQRQRVGDGESERGQGDPMYGDKWKLNFW